MACAVCTHCDGLINGNEKLIRGEYSYHKSCEKCYVCSEVDLQRAETFRGVILCSACAQRIFKGCVVAKSTKNPAEGNRKPTNPKSQKKRRERKSHKRAERVAEKSILRNGVIEIAAMGGLTDTDSGSIHQISKSPPKFNEINASKTGDKKLEKERSKDIKENSVEMGVTTEITQELLKAIHFQNQIQCNVAPTVQAKPQPKCKSVDRKRDVKCSDLRIAELGQSTEIASISATKKKNKEIPLTIKSQTTLQKTVQKPEDGKSELSDSVDYVSADWSDGNLSTIHESRGWLDRRLRSLVMMPVDYFKKNILTRSSLISVVMKTQDKQTCLSKFKMIFKPEEVKHQKRGIRRLYSTINRRRVPYKLGWLNKASRVFIAKRQLSLRFDSRDGKCEKRRKRKGCKHVDISHSYRCMRAQVMKIAGPTKSELAEMRKKMAMIGIPESFKNRMKSGKCGDIVSQGCGSIPVQMKSMNAISLR